MNELKATSDANLASYYAGQIDFAEFIATQRSIWIKLGRSVEMYDAILERLRTE